MAVLQSTPQEGEEEVDKNEAQFPSDTVVATEQHLSTSSITALKETQGTALCKLCPSTYFYLGAFLCLVCQAQTKRNQGKEA